MLRKLAAALLLTVALVGCHDADTTQAAAAGFPASPTPVPVGTAPPLQCAHAKATGIYDYAFPDVSSTPTDPGDPRDAHRIQVRPGDTAVVVNLSRRSATVRVVNAAGDAVAAYQLIVHNGEWLVSQSTTCSR